MFPVPRRPVGQLLQLFQESFPTFYDVHLYAYLGLSAFPSLCAHHRLVKSVLPLSYQHTLEPSRNQDLIILRNQETFARHFGKAT